MNTKRSFGLSLCLHVSIFGLFTLFWANPLPLSCEDEKPIVLSIHAFKTEVSAQKEVPPVKKEDVVVSKPVNVVKKKPTVKPVKQAFHEEPQVMKQSDTITIPHEKSDLSPSEKSLHVALPSRQSIIDAICQAIMNHKSYPKKAQRLGLEGDVLISFVWSAQGIESLQVSQSSGHIVLDKHACDSINKASKDFPKVEKSVEISVPMVYKLVTG